MACVRYALVQSFYQMLEIFTTQISANRICSSGLVHFPVCVFASANEK